MKNMNAIFYFPHNWYQYGSVKIRNKRKNLGKIKYANETLFEVPKDINKLTFHVNFYRATLEMDEIGDDTLVLVYFDVQNLLDTLKPKILKVKTFKTEQERKLFCNALYSNFGNSKPVARKNTPNLLLGLFISLLLILTPFYPNSDSIVRLTGKQNLNLAFIIGVGSFIALLLIYFDKNISVSSYKTRIYVTIIGFVLSLLYIEATSLLIPVILLTFTLLIRSYFEFKELDHLNYA